jgi:uncharacterized protein (DUF58 family)
VSPTRRVVVVLVGLAMAALVVPPGLVAVAVVALVSATAVDASVARRRPAIAVDVPAVLARGVPAPLAVTASAPPGTAVTLEVRQPLTPDLAVAPALGIGRIEGTVTGLRRGRHRLPGPAARATGPLGLGRWDHRHPAATEVAVYPDLPAARKLAISVRQGRFADQGRLTRGPLGLGTDFESVREYSPDDDIRQVNWRATARLARPMSNQYRVDQDRDVVCVVDTGRLMAAPLPGGATRLDAALDAVAAVAMVADEVGDRCGTLAFGADVRRRTSPRRRGGRAVVDVLFDLEPEPVESDYDLAFRRVGGGKRALVIVFTDLLDEGAARPLVEAVPVLARRHAVVVASASDPDLADMVAGPMSTPLDAYAASVAAEVLEARTRVAHQLARAGAQVVEAAPARLGAACVSTYLTLKSRARL